jgi:hypothetical protein
VKKLLRTLVSISSLLIVSCSSLPPKPRGTVWTIDYPSSEIIGAPFGEFKLKDRSYRSFRAQMKFGVNKRLIERLPLADADKYICFDPSTWDRLDSWIKDVEITADQRGWQ